MKVLLILVQILIPSMETGNKRRTFLHLCIYFPIIYIDFSVYPGGHLTHACTLNLTYNHTHTFCLSVHSPSQTYACISLHTYNLTPMYCLPVQIVQTPNLSNCPRVANSCLLFKSKYKIIFYSQNHPN